MTKPFNLDEFIAFCREKGNEHYNPADMHTCALAQYGFKLVTSFNCEGQGVPIQVYHCAVLGRHYTFSSLALALEELQ
jgi:hypothetical protein